MKTAFSRRSHFAFTLIELLVVISIIAVLASLSFTGISGAMVAANKVKAKNDMSQICTAVSAYYSEYGKYPVTATDDATAVYGASNDNSAVINVLRCSSDPNNLNPRQIKFLEVATKIGQKGCIETATGNWFDPWGKQYIIFIDADYQSDIDASKVGISPKPTISVGAASVGYYFVKNNLALNGSFPATYDKNTYLLSWQ